MGDYYLSQLFDGANSLVFFLNKIRAQIAIPPLLQEPSTNCLESTSSSYLNKKRSSNDAVDSSKSEIQKVKLIKNNKIATDNLYKYLFCKTYCAILKKINPRL